MKTFRFRLSQLHRLGQAEEEMQKRLLRDSLQAAEDARVALDKAREELVIWNDRTEQLEKNGAAVAAIQMYRRWLPNLERQVVIKGQASDRAEQVVAECRQSYLVARRQNCVMSNLRDRQEQAHHLAMQAEEQKEQDDLAAMAWPRRVTE